MGEDELREAAHRWELAARRQLALMGCEIVSRDPILDGWELLVRSVASAEPRIAVEVAAELFACQGTQSTSLPTDTKGTRSLDDINRASERAAEAQMWAGIAYSLLGDVESALSYLEEASKLFRSTADGSSSTDPRAFRMAGRCLQEAGEAALDANLRSKAKEFFDEASRMYRIGSEPDRVSLVEARTVDLDGVLPESGFLLNDGGLAPTAVLGSSTAQVLRRRCRGSAAGNRT